MLITYVQKNNHDEKKKLKENQDMLNLWLINYFFDKIVHKSGLEIIVSQFVID